MHARARTHTHTHTYTLVMWLVCRSNVILQGAIFLTQFSSSARSLSWIYFVNICGVINTIRGVAEK